MSEFHMSCARYHTNFALFCAKPHRLWLFAEDSLIKVVGEVSLDLVLRNVITEWLQL